MATLVLSTYYACAGRGWNVLYSKHDPNKYTFNYILTIPVHIYVCRERSERILKLIEKIFIQCVGRGCVLVEAGMLLIKIIKL